MNTFTLLALWLHHGKMLQGYKVSSTQLHVVNLIAKIWSNSKMIRAKSKKRTENRGMS